MTFERAKGEDATLRDWTIAPSVLSGIRSVIATSGDAAFVPSLEEIEQVLLALEKIESVKAIASAQETCPSPCTADGREGVPHADSCPNRRTE